MPISEYFVKSLFPLLIPVAGMTTVILVLKQQFSVESYLDIITVGLAGTVMFLILFVIISLPKSEKIYLMSKIRNAGNFI